MNNREQKEFYDTERKKCAEKGKSSAGVVPHAAHDWWIMERVEGDTHQWDLSDTIGRPQFALPLQLPQALVSALLVMEV